MNTHTGFCCAEGGSKRATLVASAQCSRELGFEETGGTGVWDGLMIMARRALCGAKSTSPPHLFV